MRSLLEKAIVALLNEEQDQAASLLHKFMVAQARKIHEELRQGDEVALTEGWDDEITSEEYFAEGDLDDVVEDDETDADAEMIGDDLGTTDGSEMGDMAGDADMAADDASMDATEAGMDAETAEEDAGSVEDRVDDLESQIEHLTAEFEQMMAELDDEPTDAGDDMAGDDMAGDDMAGDDMAGGETAGEDAGLADQMGGDMADESGDGEMTDMSADAEEVPSEFHEDADMGDEELDDITESVISELEKISVTMSEKEVGTGKSVSAGDKSPLPQKGVNGREGAKPVVNKGDTHGGFEREAAPSVASMKARKNTRPHAKDFQSGIPADGDKSALINKDFAGVGTKNSKSVIDGK